MMDEVQRLSSGPKPGEAPNGVVTRFPLLCDGNAEEVLSRCKEALRSVIGVNIEPWPSDDEWERILPQWFVKACFPEITREEAERRRKLPMAEQERLAEEWSVGAWAYWFQPSERSWYWW